MGLSWKLCRCAAFVTTLDQLFEKSLSVTQVTRHWVGELDVYSSCF